MTEEKQIADATRAYRDAGFTYDDLLHLAATGWVRGIQLKGLLVDACEELRQAGQVLSMSKAKHSAEVLGVMGRAYDLLGEGIAIAETRAREVVNARSDEIAHGAIEAHHYNLRVRGGKATHKKSAEVKAKIEEEYEEWRDGKSTYNSANHFAKVMASRYGVVSGQTIARWCTDWKKLRILLKSAA